MPISSIDIVSPSAGTTQPYEFTVNVDYQNQSTDHVWVRVICSFADGGGEHVAISSSTVAPGTGGTFDANFPHTTGQSNVTITARLTEFANGLGELYASTTIGDLTIDDTPVVEIDRGGFPMGFRTHLDVIDAAGSPLRLVAAAGKDVMITGTYDPASGKTVGVLVIGRDMPAGVKKRPHLIYGTRDGDVAMDVPNKGKWQATIPMNAIAGKRVRGVVALLMNNKGAYVAADSAGLQ